MSFSSWLRSLAFRPFWVRPTAPASRQRAGCRPSLVQLEERCTPASWAEAFVVTELGTGDRSSGEFVAQVISTGEKRTSAPAVIQRSHAEAYSGNSPLGASHPDSIGVVDLQTTFEGDR